MTTPDTATLRVLLERATQGEWGVGHSMERNYLYVGIHHIACIASSELEFAFNDDGSLNESEANAALIATALNALPALLSRITELEALVHGAMPMIPDIGSTASGAWRARARSILAGEQS
ncbi:MAG: hypothetical protein JWN66_4992 [Sphingomonas bacterium]|uniref:hypothetical protein n=1 Tax=Sphingomonas bacterium TaxID=1895847 RepID=UPI0026039837|nr:hypothetical protein [Sphingomonas bacterium]MDB5707876.1 hypothetical protein [Sphingomonas bacterium]